MYEPFRWNHRTWLLKLLSTQELLIVYLIFTKSLEYTTFGQSQHHLANIHLENPFKSSQQCVYLKSRTQWAQPSARVQERRSRTWIGTVQRTPTLLKSRWREKRRVRDGEIKLRQEDAWQNRRNGRRLWRNKDDVCTTSGGGKSRDSRREGNDRERERERVCVCVFVCLVERRESERIKQKEINGARIS